MKKLSVLFLVGLMATLAQANIGLIDDFSDTDLSEYTLSKVLDAGSVSNIYMESSDGFIRAKGDASDGAEQVLFLRDDYHLGVGETLLVDIMDNPVFNRDFGIVVAATKTPPSLGDPETGDVRQNYLEVARSRTSSSASYIRTYGFDGTTNLGGATASGVSLGIGPSLFIERVSLTSFNLGYIKEGVATTVQTYTDINNTDIGYAVGFFADLRAGTTSVALDNLRIVPEPATLAILGLGGLVALYRRKR
ncbi:MAG: PEP-CTERM sorting domain-containing protein [Sedimentisphaerales bacterium]|nr:PEP-CTERM sorting domain-containing protein [Sedimentisphaerales bacterium]